MKPILAFHFLVIFLFGLFVAHPSFAEQEVDYSVFADLNRDAEEVWKEMNSNGISSQEYLDAQTNIPPAIKSKIKDLKLSLNMLTQSTFIDIQALIARTEFITNPQKFKPAAINIHPFLSQLLLENLLMEVSRGWMKETSYSKFEEAHMILSCIGDNKKFYCPYTKMDTPRAKAIQGFVNSLLLLSLFAKIECPIVGLDSAWSRQAIVVGLDRHYLISQGNWASSLSLKLVLRGAGCSAGDRDLKEFVRNYNALQAKLFR